MYVLAASMVCGAQVVELVLRPLFPSFVETIHPVPHNIRFRDFQSYPEVLPYTPVVYFFCFCKFITYM